MSSVYGLTPAGFVTKSQQQIMAELKQDLQGKFGTNLNLAAQTLAGQFVGIVAEREALLWQLALAIYSSQYPDGAEGTSVDNILALNNLKRLQATASVTNPTPVVQSNGITLNGLVLTGTPGTNIPAGSLIQSSTTPQQTFKLDNAVVIGSPVNAQQTIIFSTTPASGTYVLSIVNGNQTLVSPAIPWNTQANTATVTLGAPASGTFALMLGSRLVPSIPYNVSASTLQGLLGTGYVVAAVTGGFAITFPANTYNHPISLTATKFAFSATPTLGAYTLQIGGVNLPSQPYGTTAATLQAAIRALGTQYARVLVAKDPAAAAFYINWLGMATVPTVTVATNTTDQPATISASNQLDTGDSCSVVNSLQAVINAGFYNPVTALRPYTDALVSQSGAGYAVAFGAIAPQTGQPSSAAQPIPAMQVSQSSLSSGGNTANVAVAVGAVGAPAQAIGSATCTQTGPVQVSAGQLSIIGTPISGWSGVTNQLDTIAGTNTESDTEALGRRDLLLNAQANGPLQSIVERVAQLSDVQTAIGFQNTTDAALQSLAFGSTPSSGSYQLALITGTTTAIAAAANAAAVQTAINALPTFGSAQVTGSPAFGFIIDFAGSNGGQPQPLINVVNNSTGVSITPNFSRPPKSFEIVVQGGGPQQIAQAIYQSMPAGIASYGTPAATPSMSPTAGSNALTVSSSNGIVVGQSIFGLGIANGTTVASVSGGSVTMSLAAIGTYSNTPGLFSNAVQILDAFGTPLVINFSRPVPVLFYVSIALVTDQYRVPGVPSSGINPQSKFTPGSIAALQQEVVNIGNQTPIGGLVVGFGSGGLIGAFNDIPGIVGYTLNFGPSPGPTGNGNVQLLPTQVASFQTFLVAVSYA